MLHELEVCACEELMEGRKVLNIVPSICQDHFYDSKRCCSRNAQMRHFKRKTCVLFKLNKWRQEMAQLTQVFLPLVFALIVRAILYLMRYRPIQSIQSRKNSWLLKVGWPSPIQLHQSNQRLPKDMVVIQ
uniref:Uncharacterized protein n=1 Tax=Aegilops tauschii subsp. strangulata TaxID=200361 RepID=A0A453Q3C7_AEGTS